VLANTESERAAIQHFAYYHLRLAAYTGQRVYVKKFKEKLKQNQLSVPFAFVWKALAELPLAPLYRLYLRLKRRASIPKH
jgi:hypothetical protein